MASIDIRFAAGDVFASHRVRVAAKGTDAVPLRETDQTSVSQLMFERPAGGTWEGQTVHVRTVEQADAERAYCRPRSLPAWLEVRDWTVEEKPYVGGEAMDFVLCDDRLTLAPTADAPADGNAQVVLPCPYASMGRQTIVATTRELPRFVVRPSPLVFAVSAAGKHAARFLVAEPGAKEPPRIATMTSATAGLVAI